MGRNCRFLQGKDSDPAVVGDLRSATTPATAHPCVVELINYRKDGSKFWNQARFLFAVKWPAAPHSAGINRNRACSGLHIQMSVSVCTVARLYLKIGLGLEGHSRLLDLLSDTILHA